MPYQINRRPLGIDDTVGGKGWPNSPSWMADQVVQTYEARQDYLSANSRTVQLTSGNITVASIGTPNWTTPTVPSTEAWWIDYFSLQYFITGTTTVKLRPIIWWGPTASQILYGPSVGDLATGTESQKNVGWQVNEWVMPGAFFGVAVEQILVGTGGNPTCSAFIRYTVARV